MRAYGCDVCGARFKKGNGLRKHKSAVHSSESERVRCEQCGVQFKNRIYLRKHQRDTHEAAKRGRLDCAWCGLRSTSVNTAKEHLKKCYIAHVVRAFEFGAGAADLTPGAVPTGLGEAGTASNAAWAASSSSPRGGPDIPHTPARVPWINTAEGIEALMGVVARTPDKGAALLAQLPPSPLMSALYTPQQGTKPGPGTF